MEFLGDLLGNVATGGLFGFLGSIVSVGAQYMQRRQEIVAEREERSHELDLVRLQMEQGDRETENELRLQDAAMAGRIKEQSYNLQITSANVPSSVNAIRSLFRPFLTTALVVLAAWTFWQILHAVQGNGPLAAYFASAEAGTIVKSMVEQVFFLASAAVTWWFGERGMSASNRKPV